MDFLENTHAAGPDQRVLTWRSDLHGPKPTPRRNPPPPAGTVVRAKPQTNVARREPASRMTAIDLPCVHRGPQLRVEQCQLCGLDGVTEPVYRCALHGECSANRWSKAARSAPRVCLTCKDRQPDPTPAPPLPRQSSNQIGRALFINLDRRADRARDFLDRYPSCLPRAERFAATEDVMRPHWGCWFSHRRAAQKLLDEGDEGAIIFEDDALPVTNVCTLWRELVEALPLDWQFVWLGGYAEEGKRPRVVNRWVRVPGKVLTSHAYMVRKTFLPTLVEWLSIEPCRHVDHHLASRFAQVKPPGYYGAARWLFGQKAGWSDIENITRPDDLDWPNLEDMRDVQFSPGAQPCDQDQFGRCQRPRCGLIGSSVCRIGKGTVRVEIPEVE